MEKPGRIPDSALLSFSLLLPKSKEHGISSLLNRGEVKSYVFCSYGRIALLDGLRLLACEEGSNILLPSYICRVALEPFHELGIEARFYTVSLNLRPDIADIKEKIDKKTKGILAVNYFGFPQHLEEIQNICHEYRLYLIEDNAHGFLSQNNSRLLGTFGDIGFSSFWKFLPVPNGAVLFVNNDELIDSKVNVPGFSASHKQLPSVSKKSIYTSVAHSLLSNLELHYGLKATFIRYMYRKLFLRAEGNSGQTVQNFKVRISEISLKIAENTNFEDVCRQRRDNYKFWLGEMAERKDVSIVFKELPEGVCPLYFPIIAKDVDSFLQDMLDKGIPVYHWPPLPEELMGNPDYPTANFLAEHMLVLPVHQSLDRNCLEKVVKKHG